MKGTTSVIAVLSVFVTIFLCLPAASSADWGFRIGDDGWDTARPSAHHDFTKIELFIDFPGNAGINWSGTGISNFSKTGWSGQVVNPTYLLAAGPEVKNDTLFWDVLFSGTAPKKDFRLDYLVYESGSNPVYGISMDIKKGKPVFNSSGWTALDLRNLPNYNRAPAAVPIPPTIFLLGVGLIGVVFLRKRVHR